MKYLIKNGAELDATTNDGQTALHLSIAGGFYAAKSFDKFDVVKTLIEQGAQINVQDNNEQNTPLHIAAADGKIFESKLRHVTDRYLNLFV